MRRSTTSSAFQECGISFAALKDRAQLRETSFPVLFGRSGAHGRPGVAIIEPIGANDQAHDQSGAGEYPQQQARPRPVLDRTLPALLVMSYARRVSDVLSRSLASATEPGGALPP
jgi:hypothetical protein